MRSIIGKAVPSVDGLDKVTGRARYGADYGRKGQLYGRVKYADFPHARIISVDVSGARRLPGVRAILTHSDVPGEKGFGAVVPHQVVLCSDKVRYVGDAVAIVAAETEETAEAAVRAIKVRYEELPVVSDPERALKPGSALVHEGGNLCIHHKVRTGDVEQAFAESELVVEREYSTQKVEHAYIEPEAVLAEPGENGGITITGSVQNLYSIRRALARVLDLPLNRVRVRQATLGGSFGGKDETMSALACRASLLALATDRPVKIVNTRESSMRESYKRHPYKMKYKAGVSREGLFRAMEVVIHADAGPYAAMSPFVTWRSTVQATGPYSVPNVKIDVYAAYTNNCYTSAMRGFGSPQVCFGVESLMDEIAAELGMDPLELRLLNVLRDGSVTATGQTLDHRVSVGEALLNVCRRGRFREKWTGNLRRSREPGQRVKPRKHDSPHVRRGIGISCSYRGVSLGAEGTDAAGVEIMLQTDGSIIMSSGLVDMGQGASTTISLIVAEELGVTTDRIRFMCADTSRSPDSGPTVASRTTVLAGNAARRACTELLGRLKPLAAEMLACPEASLVFEGNFVTSGQRPSKRLPFEKLASVCFERGVPLYAHGWFKAPGTSWDEETGHGDAYFTFVYGANLAEVEVDMRTGRVSVVEFVSSHDVGRLINANGARGQVCGGVAMGLGYSLLEEYTEESGRPLVRNFDEYLIPTSCDVPRIEVIFIENPDRLGPFGAKSLGEPACEIAAPAIVNAVANATGRRIRELPLTLERVLLGRSLVRKEERGSLKASRKTTGET
ncbi:MAG: xanthine dehydrogenase family protein molybdopterin-binding subunit [Candidatus Eisenbacteria bacterium]